MTKRFIYCMNKQILSLFFLALCASGCARFLDHGIEVKKPQNNVFPIKNAPADGIQLALVLSGGASRGLAHVGVIKVLQEENIPVDLVIGTSMGAIVGAMYASGMKAEDIEIFAGQAIDKSFRLLNLQVFSRERFGLLDFSPFQTVLTKHLPVQRIEEFPIIFAAVATDLNTGNQVIFTEGPAITALSATAAVPGIFSPVQHNEHWLVDGGLVNNLPADIAHDWDADVIIAVNAMKEPDNFQPDGYFDIIAGCIHVIISKTGKANESFADILITPSVGDFSFFDFNSENLDILVKAGETAARKNLPAIRQKISQALINKTLKLVQE